MVTINQVESQDDVEGVRELLFEYLSWATDQAKELYDEDVDVNEMLDLSMSEINLFSPPSGTSRPANALSRPADSVSRPT